MHIKESGIYDTAVSCTKEYGSYIIENRAITDFRDGLKPVQRRILWSMYKQGMGPNTGHKKSARVTGDVMGKYHPHGSSYGTLAKMVKSAEPTIDGQGNFGSYEDPPAAERYTEARLTHYSYNNLLDREYLAVVPLVPNYDGEEIEPVYLPAKLPNLLINGSAGIAMGCSSCIPSFSLESVKKLVVHALKGKKVTAQVCAKLLEFKFHYGGECVSDDATLLEYFKTGKQTLYFQPTYQEKGSTLSLLSHAPGFSVAKLLEKSSEMKGVKRIEDKRGKNKFNIEITFADTDDGEKAREKVLDILTTSMHCQTYVTHRHDDGETVSFKQTTIPQLIADWIADRIDLEKRVVKRLVSLEKRKLQVQQWLLFAVLNKEVIIRALDKKDPSKFLQKTLKISEEQAEYTLDLKVRNLAKLEEEKIRVKIREIKEEVLFLKSELKSLPARILKQLKE